MNVDAGTITWLVIGALLLAALAVVIDRVNFPQKPFRPQRIEPGMGRAVRDRTGAHIVEVSQEEWDESERRSRGTWPSWMKLSTPGADRASGPNGRDVPDWPDQGGERRAT